MFWLSKKAIYLIISIIFFFITLFIICILIYREDNNNSLCDINTIVTKVYDGDTVQAGKYKIRLIWIDAPEGIYEGSEIKDYKFYGCPELSTQYAEEKLLNKKILFCQDRSNQEHDKYGRKLRYAMIEEEWKENPFSYFAIKKGYAKRYAYANYTWKDEFKTLEQKAKENNIWIWTEECQQEDFEIKQASNQCGLLKEKEGCNIKWNISSKWKYLYYNIEDNNYNRVKINISNGERWFCTTQEAIDCGWISINDL